MKAILRRAGLAASGVTFTLGILTLILCPWFALTLFPWSVAVGAIAGGTALRLWLKPLSRNILCRRLLFSAVGLFLLCAFALGMTCVQHLARSQRRLESSGGRSAWRFLNVVPEADIASLGARLCGVMHYLPSRQAREVHALLKHEYRRMGRDGKLADVGNVALISVLDSHVRHAFILHPRHNGGKPLGVLLFLHGAGAPMALYPWLLSGLADRENLIIVCPSWGSGEWSQAGAAEYALERLRSAMAARSVNPQRIYLGGISMGGAGGWRLLDAEPTLFRGFVCISGYGAAQKATDVPVLTVEGGEDAFVDGQADPRCRNPLSRLVIVPGDDHFALLRSTATITDSICEWMDSVESP